MPNTHDAAWFTTAGSGDNESFNDTGNWGLSAGENEGVDPGDHDCYIDRASYGGPSPNTDGGDTIQTLNLLNGDDGDFVQSTLQVSDGVIVGAGWHEIALQSVNGTITGNAFDTLHLYDQPDPCTIDVYCGSQIIIEGSGTITFNIASVPVDVSGTLTLIAANDQTIDLNGSDATGMTLNTTHGSFVNYTGSPTLVSEGGVATAVQKAGLVLLLLLD